MPNLTLQLTIPALGVVNASAAMPAQTGGPGNLATNQPQARIYCQFLLFQYNGVNAVRYGVNTKVSVTVPTAVNGGAAGFGILLLPTSSGTQQTPINYATYLDDWWFAGTPGDVIDILTLQ